MNDYEKRQMRIDRSSMPYGTREQREQFFESLLPRGEVCITDEMRERGLPGFCVRRGKHINIKQECIRCGGCRRSNDGKQRTF